jgi:hypothetical protein
VFCAGVICYSLTAAIGFAVSSRSGVTTTTNLAIDTRNAWKARIERTARQLDQFGMPRPAGVIQAELGALLRAPGADGCVVINGPVTKEVCPKVDKLRSELAASKRAVELDASLVADRKRLEAVPVAASVADPQSATLSRLTALGEAHIRDIIAILIAVLVETGSALGLTFMVLAIRPASPPQQPAVRNAEESQSIPAAPEPAQPAPLVAIPATPADMITRWAYSRLDILNAGRVQAENAYQDFIAWCQAEGLNTCSRQMFGRCLTQVVKGMGGRKVKINGRAYYEGVTLQGDPLHRQVLAAAA